jgi:hypothetical protein
MALGTRSNLDTLSIGRHDFNHCCINVYEIMPKTLIFIAMLSVASLWIILLVRLLTKKNNKK